MNTTKKIILKKNTSKTAKASKVHFSSKCATICAKYVLSGNIAVTQMLNSRGVLTFFFNLNAMQRTKRLTLLFQNFSSLLLGFASNPIRSQDVLIPNTRNVRRLHEQDKNSMKQLYIPRIIRFIWRKVKTFFKALTVITRTFHNTHWKNVYGLSFKVNQILTRMSMRIFDFTFI